MSMHIEQPATQRLDPHKAAPGAFKPMLQIEAYLGECGLDTALIELVKIRASQINGCAYCINMHTRDARKAGESEQRLYLLNAWREAGCYTARERAALAWTEALTRIAETHVDDALFREVRGHFDDKALTELTLLITQINSWNRFAIAFRYPPD